MTPGVVLEFCIDGLVFENVHQVGIWRVFYEILSRAHDPIRITLWLRRPPVQPLPPGVRVVQDSGRITRRPYRFSRRLARAAGIEWPPLPQEVRNADVYHSSYFTECPVAGPTVVTTVYDMIAESLYPILGGAGDTYAKRATLSAATRVIAISQASADDLVSFYPDVSERIRVVPLGADHLVPAARAEVNTTFNDRSGYVLFVGQRFGYKNFHLVLDAMTRPMWPKGVSLRVVGPPLEEHELRYIARCRLVDRVESVGRVNDTDLARAYAGARCFVFPSLLEGFGLPVLEAQLNRCPAVLSDIPVFREVAGNAAVFFDPRLGEGLAEAVTEACDPLTRRRLAEPGIENARRFRWDTAAEQTFAVYREAAEAVGKC